MGSVFGFTVPSATPTRNAVFIRPHYTVALPETVVLPPCPKCESLDTERLEFMNHKPFNVYFCFQCGHVWRVPIEPPKPQ